LGNGGRIFKSSRPVWAPDLDSAPKTNKQTKTKQNKKQKYKIEWFYVD
jgi:hypothetical protein